MTCLFKNAHYKQRIPISDEDEEIEINHNLIDYDIVFEDNFDYESIHELFEGVIRSEIYNYNKQQKLNTEIITNTILGYNTSIGNNCIINKSVIGINCIIGNNTHITNSFILLVILQIYLYYSNWHKWYRNGK